MNCYFFFKIPGEVTAAPSLQKKKNLVRAPLLIFLRRREWLYTNQKTPSYNNFMKILIVFLKQKSVYCLQSKRRSLNICNDSSPRENIMNSLPSSYFGSCLGKLRQALQGLRTEWTQRNIRKVGRGRLMVSQYPPLPFFDFSCNIPSPLTFWEAGGGELGVSLHLQDRL